ncbi:hypothetical protein BKA61DRAFT_620165 [Leptodontidium sp. MPI-SDFR-AT-0119]|nr:hypothetical protein BKA61DRAFT_620165 [Leptodontidium sp. MPI-SDFR-AT-0119]
MAVSGEINLSLSWCIHLCASLHTNNTVCSSLSSWHGRSAVWVLRTAAMLVHPPMHPSRFEKVPWRFRAGSGTGPSTLEHGHGWAWMWIGIGKVPCAITWVRIF